MTTSAHIVVEDGDAVSGILASPASDRDVEELLAGVRTWLLRAGGEVAVRRAEQVGAMAVLSGVEYLSGQHVSVSVPLAEVAARAA